MMGATSTKESFAGCALAILTIATPLQAQTAAAGAADSSWHFAIVGSDFPGRPLFCQPRHDGGDTYDRLDAAVVNFGYTEVVKMAVGRERPNRQDDKSFLSGHTSNSFALASVAQRHYGWKVGIPAYLAAGLVGASRIQQDKHYLSDVVAGATLGYIVGRTVVRVNGRPPAPGQGRRAQVDLTPIGARHRRGWQLSVAFQEQRPSWKEDQGTSRSRSSPPQRCSARRTRPRCAE